MPLIRKDKLIVGFGLELGQAYATRPFDSLNYSEITVIYSTLPVDIRCTAGTQ